MSDARDLRSLLQVARGDGPGASSRERIWEGVSLAPQLSLVSAARTRAPELVRPGAGSGTASIKAAAGSVAAAASAGKLLLAGAVVGSALTLGLGALLLRGQWSDRASHERSAVVERTREPTGVGVLAPPASQALTDGPAEPLPSPPGGPASTVVVATLAPVLTPRRLRPRTAGEGPGDEPAEPAKALPSSVSGAGEGASRGAVSRVRAAAPPGVDRPEEGDLSREIERVGQARRALGRGEAAAALVALDAATRGGTLRFEPEELSLRVRALRMLGRTAEAAQVEAALRARFPDNFLAR